MNIYPVLDKIYQGDAADVLSGWPDGIIQTVVTSPPYWGLRDYKMNGQLGVESTPGTYVAKLVEVFRQVRRVLKDDGTVWLNLGDSYSGSAKGADKKNGSTSGYKQQTNSGSINVPVQNWKIVGLKNKDLVGIPWRVAFALQADGWFLRSDIIWSKPNPMPESVTDRPTKSHEYIFLLSKSERYFYDADAIKEPAIYFDDDRKGRADPKHKSMPTGERNGIRPVYKDARSYDGKHTDKQRGHGRRHAGFNDRWDHMEKNQQCSSMRNKRSVWTIATRPFAEAHFATFPEVLVAPCVQAGSREGDVVLDPFMGSGTTALVARRNGRRFLGIELNPEYIEIAERRIKMEMAQMQFGEVIAA